MNFFNLISTPGLGQNQDGIKETEKSYGQANLAIKSNVSNGNLFVKGFHNTFIDQGFEIDIGYVYNSQAALPWRLNLGKTIKTITGNYNEPGSMVTVIE